jgi:hypothetical protein
MASGFEDKYANLFFFNNSMASGFEDKYGKFIFFNNSIASGFGFFDK